MMSVPFKTPVNDSPSYPKNLIGIAINSKINYLDLFIEHFLRQAYNGVRR